MLQKILAKGNPFLRDNAELRAAAFFKQSDVRMHLPAEIGEQTVNGF